MSLAITVVESKIRPSPVGVGRQEIEYNFGAGGIVFGGVALLDSDIEQRSVSCACDDAAPYLVVVRQDDLRVQHRAAEQER